MCTICMSQAMGDIISVSLLVQLRSIVLDIGCQHSVGLTLALIQPGRTLVVISVCDHTISTKCIGSKIVQLNNCCSCFLCSQHI